MKKLLIVAGLMLTTVGAATVASASAGAGPITIDGKVYPADRTTGGATHYNTPTPSPQAASNAHHTWTGNGSEHLPCVGGIHWISNANVLTVSHCLEVPDVTTPEVPEVTTTEVPEVSTTEVPEVTTTEVPEVSTTEVPEVTTTEVPEVSTTEVPEVTTTEVPEVSTTEVPEVTTTEVPEVSTTEVTTEPTLVRGDSGTVPTTVPDVTTTVTPVVAGDSGTELPSTGAGQTMGMALMALGFLLTGLGVVAMTRRPEAEPLI